MYRFVAPLFAVFVALVAIAALAAVQAPAWSLVVMVLVGAAAVLVASRARQETARRDLYEKALKKKIDRLRDDVREHSTVLDRLADGLDVAVFLTDGSQVVSYANERAISMFQFDKPANQTLLAITLSNELAELVAKSQQERTSQQAELNLRHPEERIVRVHVWPESPENRRYFVSLYDVSDLRRLERVRRDFVANVSHELRTPMTTIRAMAETIEDETGGDAFAHHNYIDRIIKEVDRLTRITDDLLTLSVAESGTVSKMPTNAAEVVRSVVQPLVKKAESKGLTLSLNAPTELEVHVNPTQLSQVAINLVDNAINYTKEGEIAVTLSEEGGLMKMEVRDTGIGLASEHLDRIFERFYRVDKGRSRATGGTGLGLSIVRHIVESHRGRVEVSSEMNKGTTFTVWMPLS